MARPLRDRINSLNQNATRFANALIAKQQEARYWNNLTWGQLGLSNQITDVWNDAQTRWDDHFLANELALRPVNYNYVGTTDPATLSDASKAAQYRHDYITRKDDRPIPNPFGIALPDFSTFASPERNQNRQRSRGAFFSR